MLTEERDRMIDQIRRLPSLIEGAVSGLTDEQLDTRYREGGWTLRQVVHHLADSHLHAFIRMKLTLQEDHPTIQTYDQDDWAASPDAAMPVDASLLLLRGLHDRWSTLLENVSDEEWARTAHHPENGTMRLDDFLRIYSRHGEHHVGQINGLRQAQGW